MTKGVDALPRCDKTVGKSVRSTEATGRVPFDGLPEPGGSVLVDGPPLLDGEHVYGVHMFAVGYVPTEREGLKVAIKFTARHMSGGTKHEHIASLKWIEDGKSETQQSTREVLVDWIKNKGGSGYVLDTQGDKAAVKVVEASPPYLQTVKDGIWTDNLLALPTY